MQYLMRYSRLYIALADPRPAAAATDPKLPATIKDTCQTAQRAHREGVQYLVDV
jgi:hypothetical protein